MDFAAAIAAISVPPERRGGATHPEFPAGVEAALAWLAAQPLSPEQLAEVAAALDRRPARWIPHPALVERAATLLYERGGSTVPRFLIVAAEDGYVGEADAFDDEDRVDPLMALRRDFEARCLAHAIEAMERADPDQRAALLRAALPAPEDLAGDSARHMGARILDHLATNAPERFAWLRELLTDEAPDSPYGWAVGALAHWEHQQKCAALDRLAALRDDDDWDGIIREAPRLLEAHPAEAPGYVYLVTAYRWLERFDEAERVARQGFEYADETLPILDAVVPPMLLDGRAHEVLELWDQLRPTVPPSDDPEDRRRHRARLHLRRIASEQHHVLANLVGNIIVAYSRTGQWSEGVRDVAGYVDALNDPRLLGNAACLYAMAGDSDAALREAGRALEAGQPLSFFEHDAELDSLRDLPAFRALLADAAAARSSDDDDDDSQSDPAAVQEILRQLESSELAEIRQGLRALRGWVEAASEPDLSPFGVEPSEDELVDCPLFDGIVERHGLELGHDALVDLVASLFNRNVEYHGTKASIDAARLLVGSNDPSVHERLVDVFVQACRDYEDGHRYHTASGMDLFIDEILAACAGPPLAKLMCWAYQHHYTQDLGDLLVPTLRAGLRAADERRVLDAFEASLRDPQGALYTYEMPTALARIGQCLELPELSTTARQRLETLQAEARAELTIHETIARRLRSGALEELMRLLTELGPSIPVRNVALHQEEFAVALAVHHRNVPVPALVHALPHLLPAKSLFPPALRLLAELRPDAATQAIERLLQHGDSSIESAVLEGLERANRPELFADLRRALRAREAPSTSLPTQAHPALTALLQSARAR